MIPAPDCSPELRALAVALGSVEPPCRTTDPELWFALDPAPAVSLCAGCHAIPECAAYARANREQHGIWAGVDFEAKRTNKRKDTAA